MKKALVCVAVIGVVCAVAITACKASAPKADEKAAPANAAVAAQNADKPADKNAESFKVKYSYCLGMFLGRNMKKGGIDELDTKSFADGMACSISGSKPKMSDAEIKSVMQQFDAYMRAKIAKKAAADQAKVKAYLEANKKKQGVKVTKSGLQYEILKAGTGDVPKATDTVKVHYRGTLINGTEFDSSYSRGKPAEFPVNGVIKGWTEALQLMKTGAKWKLVIPSDLAYGPRGAGGLIGPNATLVFEVELLEIVKAEQPQSVKSKAGATTKPAAAEPKK